MKLLNDSWAMPIVGDALSYLQLLLILIPLNNFLEGSLLQKP